MTIKFDLQDETRRIKKKRDKVSSDELKSIVTFSKKLFDNANIFTTFQDQQFGEY